jgi:hypothetical protein
VGNSFRDSKKLAHGCFPQMKELLVYSSWGGKNESTEQYFPAKVQATSLKYLSTSSLMQTSAAVTSAAIDPLLEPSGKDGYRFLSNDFHMNYALSIFCHRVEYKKVTIPPGDED